jgi:hypothetical protein
VLWRSRPVQALRAAAQPRHRRELRGQHKRHRGRGTREGFACHPGYGADVADGIRVLKDPIPEEVRRVPRLGPLSVQVPLVRLKAARRARDTRVRGTLTLVVPKAGGTQVAAAAAQRSAFAAARALPHGRVGGGTDHPKARSSEAQSSTSHGVPGPEQEARTRAARLLMWMWRIVRATAIGRPAVRGSAVEVGASVAQKSAHRLRPETRLLGQVLASHSPWAKKPDSRRPRRLPFSPARGASATVIGAAARAANLGLDSRHAASMTTGSASIRSEGLSAADFSSGNRDHCLRRGHTSFEVQLTGDCATSSGSEGSSAEAAFLRPTNMPGRVLDHAASCILLRPLGSHFHPRRDDDAWPSRMASRCPLTLAVHGNDRQALERWPGTAHAALSLSRGSSRSPMGGTSTGGAGLPAGHHRRRRWSGVTSCD